MDRRGGPSGRLARRITLAYVALILGVTAVLGAYLTATLRSAGLAQLEEKMVAEAALIALAVEPALTARDSARSDGLARRFATAIGAHVTIVAADGVVLGDSDVDPAGLGSRANRPEVAAVLRAGASTGAGARHSVTVDRDLLYVAVAAGDPPLGVVRVARDLRGVESEVSRAAAAVLAALAVAGLLAALLAGVIAARITRPIVRLTAAARSLARGEPTHPLDATGRDELGELGRTFDEMATRLRATIESLSTDRARLGAVLTTMGDGVVLLDEEGAVVLANRAASRLLGIPAFGPEETSAPGGRVRLIELVHDHDLHELVQLVRSTEESRSELVRFGSSGGELRLVATPVGRGSRAVLLLIQDVTEVRRAETIRRDFVANVSHELRTPIASLKALVETLEGGALDDPPAARDFLHRMHVEVDGLAQLVQELLELARIEAGRAPMALERRDVAVVVAAAVERLRPQADRAGLALEVATDEGLPVASIDERRIESVVINLLHNAIKFTPAGGRIAVRAERGSLGLRVSVCDTGAGIPTEDLPRLFERFYKTDRSRASTGTGLGLAIVKHVVQAHGGEVGVESAPGRGSTFWFTLPAAHQC